MTDLGQNLKSFVSKGVEAIGSTASNLAASTRHRITAFTLQNQKRDLLEKIGTKAYECWKNGAAFPEELQEDMAEVLRIEEQLNAKKPEDNAEDIPAVNDTEEDTESDVPDESNPDVLSETADGPEEISAEDEAVPAVEESSAGQVAETETTSPDKDNDPAAVSVPDTEQPCKPDPSLCSAINALFDNIPPVDKMADKVNSSLDEMGKRLKKFSTELGKQISEIAGEISNKKKSE